MDFGENLMKSFGKSMLLLLKEITQVM